MTTREDAATEDRQEPAPVRRRLLERPTIRAGTYAWSIVGLLLVTVAALYIMSRLRLVVIPFVLALFPAAVLSGPVTWLKRRMPDGLAALLVVLGVFALLGGVISALVPIVAAQLTGEGGLVEQAQSGAQQLQAYLEQGPFGFQPVQVDDLLQRARDQFSNGSGVASTALGAAAALVEGVAGLLLGLVVLFFYLKDGPRMGRWLRDLFPPHVRDDAEAVGGSAWQTIGGYIRGQLLIALVDAVLIGIAIVVLRVPLALPLSVLVFFGGLFPVVGAFVSGLIAVLVALATVGFTRALILLAVIVVIQQVEGDVLAPVVFGRTVRLHPAAILAALTAGGVLLGVLGAFIAVPVAASAARAVGYLRERVPG